MKDKESKGGKSIPFEQALDQLEKLVEKLEAGNLPLEDSLQAFEDGMKLTKLCEQKLNEAQRKIEVLVKGKGGRGTDVEDFLEEEA